MLGSYIRPWILKNILKICSRSPIANPRLLNIHIKSTAKKVWTLFWCFHFSFAFSYMGKPSFKELNFTDPYAIFLSSVKISQMISSRHNFLIVPWSLALSYSFYCYFWARYLPCFLLFSYFSNAFRHLLVTKIDNNAKKLLIFPRSDLRYYATFKVRKSESLFYIIDTCLQKTTTCIALQAE